MLPKRPGPNPGKRPNPDLSPGKNLRSGPIPGPPQNIGKNPFRTAEGQGISHPKSAAPVSHDLNRHKLCCICWRVVGAGCALNDRLKTGICSLFFAGVELDWTDRRIPLGICKNCRNGINTYINTSVNSRKLDILHTTEL